MKFGVREICDVVLRAKAEQTIGNQTFKKDEPVIYFDTAKTSTVEGTATTVYATGGKGNARLIAWEGERVITFTMEDALISPMGFAILSGAGLIEAQTGKPLNVHTTSQVEVAVPSTGTDLVVDLTSALAEFKGAALSEKASAYGFVMTTGGNIGQKLGVGTLDKTAKSISFDIETLNLKAGETIVVMVDYYIEKTSGATQLEITPDKFAGNYYLEADTLFRRQEDGVDMPAQFIVPNVKIQSAFNFAMASSGDPSTFTFTMDAFPDYTKFDRTKKVLFALQIIEE